MDGCLGSVFKQINKLKYDGIINFHLVATEPSHVWSIHIYVEIISNGSFLK